VKLAELYPNSFFGEAGMLSDEPRSATVVALEDATVEIIYEEDLGELLEKNPVKVEMIMNHMSHRLRSLTEQYQAACARVHEASLNAE
jgi:CRP-like cAMP-binding protein